MLIIDADAHVLENEHTWDFLSAAEQRYRPSLVRSEHGQRRYYWLIEGKVQGFNVLPSEESELQARTAKMGRIVYTPPETREVNDVPARLRAMDALGVDIQVCHPTLFIERITDRPATEVALCRSWNRWMAEAWQQGEGRLRWTCALPLLAMSEALTELQWCVEHGAVGVFTRAIEGNRLVNDPYFFPLYEAAQKLDVPIIVHVGNANPENLELLASSGSGYWRFRLPTIGSFHTLVSSGIMHQFPHLRFGYVEAAAQWLPAVLRDLPRRAQALGRSMEGNILADNRIWVTCETDDDVPYILTYGTGDHLVIGSDYGHADQSTELNALSKLREMPGLSEEAWRKIVDDNARALFGPTVAAQYRQPVAV